MRRTAIGLIGWGTVGGGVVDLLTRDHGLFAERCGLDLHLKTIVTRSPARARDQSPGTATVTDQISAIIDDPEIGVVIHLVGGTTEAKTLLEACLRAGKHVVTANKALIAEHGDALFALAAEHRVGIAFEAAVAGGIPVIAALRDGLVANRIESISGILNGTCNFILTKMEQEAWGYAEALAEAQRLGYAEADPTLDVDGTDTAHKLAILARIAFNGRIPLNQVRIQGIQRLTAEDIASARTMGARIKLLAVGAEEQAGLEGFQIRVRLTPAGETQPADGQAVVVDRPAHTQPGVRIVARKEYNLDRAPAGGKQALDEGHRHARRGRHGLAFALVLAVGLGPVRAEDGIALGEVEESARRDRDREQGWLREGRLSHRRRWPRRRHRDRRAGGRPSLRRRR